MKLNIVWFSYMHFLPKIAMHVCTVQKSISCCSSKNACDVCKTLDIFYYFIFIVLYIRISSLKKQNKKKPTMQYKKKRPQVQPGPLHGHLSAVFPTLQLTVLLPKTTHHFSFCAMKRAFSQQKARYHFKQAFQRIRTNFTEISKPTGPTTILNPHQSKM